MQLTELARAKVEDVEVGGGVVMKKKIKKRKELCMFSLFFFFLLCLIQGPDILTSE